MTGDILPLEKDTEKTGRGGMALAHKAFNYDHWQYREFTGRDVGMDCQFEYINESDEWINAALHCQVKGTKTLSHYLLKDNLTISYSLDVKTLNYALRDSSAFLLLIGDLVEEKVYYLPIQDYFIENPKMYEKLKSKSKERVKLKSDGKKSDPTLNIHVPLSNLVTYENDEQLIKLAKSSYQLYEGKIIKHNSDS